MMTTFPDLSSPGELPKLEIFNPSGFSLPFNQAQISSLVRHIETGEKIHFFQVEIVFTTEEEITEINKHYLDHDYVTDIISFRYDEDSTNQQIEGTLYCCAPRISEQSKELNTPEEKEFLRIIAHGLLHLAGYDDASAEEKKKMTQLEDFYLAKITNLL